MNEVEPISEVNISGAFGRVPLVLLCVTLVVVHFGLEAAIVSRVAYYAVEFATLLAFSIAFILLSAAGRLKWWFNIRNRMRVIEDLEPGVYWLFDNQQSRIELNEFEPMSEQEQISTFDQASTAIRVWSWMDLLWYMFMAAFLLYPIVSRPLYWHLRITLIVFFAALALRWLYLGDGIIGGFNRLRIDPQGWEWGGWSKRLRKSGRWADARVLVKPMTKRGRDRYFVVIGDDDGSVGIIVPKASVVLIERAMVTIQEGASP